MIYDPLSFSVISETKTISVNPTIRDPGIQISENLNILYTIDSKDQNIARNTRQSSMPIPPLNITVDTWIWILRKKVEYLTMSF